MTSTYRPDVEPITTQRVKLNTDFKNPLGVMPVGVEFRVHGFDGQGWVVSPVNEDVNVVMIIPFEMRNILDEIETGTSSVSSGATDSDELTAETHSDPAEG